jgi:hypothetical protein
MADKDSKLDNTFSNPADSNKSATPEFSIEREDGDIRLSVKGAVSEGSTPKFELNLNPSTHTAQFEKDTLLKEQLESVDFYIEQGFLEVAFTTLERLELFFPNHPMISERLDRMANMELRGSSNQTNDAPIDKPVEIPKSEPTALVTEVIESNFDF